MNRITEQYAEDKSKKIAKALKDKGIRTTLSVLEKFIEEEMDDAVREKRFRTVDYEITPHLIQNIIKMNDGLYKRFGDAYKELVAMREKVKKEMATGEADYTDYVITIEFFIGYNRVDGIPTANRSMLCRLNDQCHYHYPTMNVYIEDPELPDYDQWAKVVFSIDGDSWNTEELRLPGLEDHYLYQFMWLWGCIGIFHAYDLEYLCPEDLNWQITVEYGNFKSPFTTKEYFYAVERIEKSKKN